MWAFSLVHKWLGGGGGEDFTVACVCVCKFVLLFFFFLIAHTHTWMPAWRGVARRTRRWALGSFDAFLSGPAWFALFVFNDASREADSRRVERAAFDVSDYDITDVQSRRAEEWGSVLGVFFFFFLLLLLLPSGILFREKGREGTETHGRRGGEIKYLAKTRMRFCVPKNCALPIYYLARIWHNYLWHKNKSLNIPSEHISLKYSGAQKYSHPVSICCPAAFTNFNVIYRDFM